MSACIRPTTPPKKACRTCVSSAESGCTLSESATRRRNSLRITLRTNTGICESGACRTCARMRDCGGKADIHIASLPAVRSTVRDVATFSRLSR